MNVVGLMLNHLNFELMTAGSAATLIGQNVGQLVHQSRIGSAGQLVDFSIEQSLQLAFRHVGSDLAGAPDQVTRVLTALVVAAPALDYDLRAGLACVSTPESRR